MESSEVALEERERHFGDDYDHPGRRWSGTVGSSYHKCIIEKWKPDLTKGGYDHQQREKKEKKGYGRYVDQLRPREASRFKVRD